ncbi:MAG TPA: type II secretion system F family protein [Luteitalea sp.]|nr:type II secretion system F family protein [Luteitalea sp.]
MLQIMLILGLLSGLAAFVVLFGTSSGTRARRSGDHDAPVEVPPGAPAFVKVFFPVIRVFSRLMSGISWPTYRSRAAVAINRSGWGESFTVDHLLAVKVLTAMTLPLFGALLFPIFRNPAFFVLGAIAAFYLPDRMLAGSRGVRERAIVRALPGAVDVLSLSVEAGLEFLIALERLVKRGLSGPLRDELTTVLNDIRLGTSRSNALRAMATRLEIQQVSSFVSTLVQADLLGASIGDVLKQQAAFLRTERFQRAEKLGGQATQKIIFPMLLFIFPAVLLVVIAPVVLKFIYRDF